MKWLALLLEDTKYEPFKIWNIFSWVLLLISSAIGFAYETLFGEFPDSILSFVKLSFLISGINVVIHCCLAIYFFLKLIPPYQESFTLQTITLKNKFIWAVLFVLCYFILLSLALESLF